MDGAFYDVTIPLGGKTRLVSGKHFGPNGQQRDERATSVVSKFSVFIVLLVGGHR